MDWNQAKDMLLIGMASALSGYLGIQIRHLVASVEKLNLQIALILQRVEGHENRINRLEEKL